MSATTWRINTFDILGRDLELSALSLYDAVGAADAGATLTSSHAPISGTLSNLTDGSTTTMCRFAAADVRAPGFYIQWVLPVAKDVSAVCLGGGSEAVLFPTRFSIQWFDTNLWTTASNNGTTPWPGIGVLSAPQNFGPSFASYLVLTAGSSGIVFDKEYSVPSPTMFGVQSSPFLDAEFGGAGRVYGTVARKNTPANVPLIRRVRLHISRDGRMIRETWSNADGSYEFKSISMNYEYDTVAWDHETVYRTVVANNLKPEAM